MNLQTCSEFDPMSYLDCLHVRCQSEGCLEEIRGWMLRNMLKINDERTKLFSIFVNPQQAKFVTEASITLGGAVVRATGNVCNFGTMVNTPLDTNYQISAVVRSCNYPLRRIAQAHQYISDEACKLAILALVIIRLDYCNEFFAGATKPPFDKPQRIQNWAARLMARPSVTPQPGSTHHASFAAALLALCQAPCYLRLCLHVFRCLHEIAPLHVTELLHPHTRDQRLRPPSHLQLRPCCPKRAVRRVGFHEAGPPGWNILPSCLRAADSLLRFQKAVEKLPVQPGF